MHFYKVFLHILLALVLTVLTQVGGVLYMVCVLYTPSLQRGKRVLIFLITYLLFSLLILPVVAPFFGRVPIRSTDNLKVHSFFYQLANRHYVTPELYNLLVQVSGKLAKNDPGIKLVCLDANFPFITGFPLLPHLSHNDGRKVDIAFIYNNADGVLTSQKPTVSGYGFFSGPASGEFNQASVCVNKGYWQYDLAKYLTLGTVNPDLNLNKRATTKILRYLLAEPQTEKIFLERHLVVRMGLKNNKLRFQGCQSVRHDDHIHLQIQ